MHSTELYTVDSDPNLRKKSSKAKAYIEYTPFTRFLASVTINVFSFMYDYTRTQRVSSAEIQLSNR
jgi:hypothetical protein